MHFHHSLRRRLKAQHDVITSQSTRLAYYQANMEKDAPVQDHSTGQSNASAYMYIRIYVPCKGMHSLTIKRVGSKRKGTILSQKFEIIRQISKF